MRAVNTQALIDGLILFLCFIPIVTLHEWGHAWMAWKCGDNTAYNDGRVSLNPGAHIDPLDTIVVPLIAVVMGAFGSSFAGLLIGWGRPVPVVISTLRRGRLDDTLVSLAGPAMNLVLALVVLAAAKLALMPGWEAIARSAVTLAELSVFLAVFNLLPIPPLDGGHVAKNLLRLKHETYAQICQYSFIILIVVVQLRPVMHLLSVLTDVTMAVLAWPFGLL